MLNKGRRSLMFTSGTKRLVDEEFNRMVPFLEENKPDVLKRLDECSQDLQIAMKFLYSAMPVSDVADYDFGTFQDFAEHALFLRKNVSWCADVPDDIFLNYVLYHRINNEDIRECRKFFYRHIYERVSDMSMKEAALEVNYWCAEHVTYRSTDIRTASPLAVWNAGFGRCGEESTFTVTALRSIGIPARQIYAPRWSHCDDNHAWVEAWCDGKWHFMGACEPEPVLDLGWFIEPATRAMFIHNRTFSPIISSEKIISTQGKTYIINRTENYAPTRPFSVKVVDGQSKPVSGAHIRFEVLNMSEFYPVVSKVTDDKGEAEIILGLADIHLHVRKDGRFTECIVDTAQSDNVTVTLDHGDGFSLGVRDFTVKAAKADKSYNVHLTEEQLEEKKRRIACADKLREERVSSFYRSREAEEIIARYPFKEELKGVFKKARGNFDEIAKYLTAPVERDNPYLRVKLLTSLSDKDFYDLKGEVLLDHFQKSLPFAKEYDEEMFVKYVMAPRIHFERLTPYRKFILQYFDEKSKAEYRSNPQLIWDFVSERIHTKEDLEYGELFTSPEGLLKIRHGSAMSRKILFVAICRTVGVPARISPVTLSPEYYLDGKFVPAENRADGMARLVIRSSGETRWNYYQNWTLGVLERDVYRTLDLSGIAWKNGCAEADVPAGDYRLIVSNRVPNGNLSAREYRFTVSRAETTEISIDLPDAQITEHMENKEIPDFRLMDREGNSHALKDLAEDAPVVVMWLEEGKEPTEHILNELMEWYQGFNAIGSRIIFILRDERSLSDTTLQKVLNCGLKADILYGDFEKDAPKVAGSLDKDRDKFPLVYITTDGLHSVYAFSGYNVGMAELLLKIVNAVG